MGNVDLLASREPGAELLHEHEWAARDLIRAALEAGEVRDVHPVVASTVFFGALNAICRGYDPDGTPTLDQMIDTALDLLFHDWAR